MELSYIAAIGSAIISFLIALFFTKSWIRIAKKARIVGKDMNKTTGKEIAEAGGISVVFAIVFGLCTYVFFKTFVLVSAIHFVEIFTVTSILLLACFIGFVDDIIGWKKGLKQWQRPLLTIPIAIPLMVINAGHSYISLPFIGSIDFGILYPLVLIPIGIVGATNGFNMLAGLNGLEAGIGAIILSFICAKAFQIGALWVSLISLCAVVALIGFLFFNWYPARVFPGDSLTYPIGALIATLIIFGNMEKLGLFLFAPYFLELALKAKSKFKAESFGIPKKDGSLKAPKKIRSITHLALKFTKKELSAVLLIIGLEIVWGLVLFYVF